MSAPEKNRATTKSHPSTRQTLISFFLPMMQTLKKYGFFTYGQVIPGLTINGDPAPYPVLNERTVRAGAGIMLVFGAVAFALAFFEQNFLPLKIVVAIFFIDFFTKVVIGTRFSPVSNIAEFIVRNQAPEYVGAIQKRFAWSIGLLMSFTMIMLLFVFDVRGSVNLAVCSFCLLVMWFETSFGICVGCKMYYGLIKAKLIQAPEYRPACPGGVCSLKKPH